MQEKLGGRHVKAKLEVAGQVQEYLEGIKAVKAFGLSGEKSEALTRSLRSMRGEAMKYEGMTGLFVTLAMMILQAGVGLVALVGVGLLAGGGVDVIKLLAFVVIGAKIYAPLILHRTACLRGFTKYSRKASDGRSGKGRIGDP